MINLNNIYYVEQHKNISFESLTKWKYNNTLQMLANSFLEYNSGAKQIVVHKFSEYYNMEDAPEFNKKWWAGWYVYLIEQNKHHEYVLTKENPCLRESIVIEEPCFHPEELLLNSFKKYLWLN